MNKLLLTLALPLVLAFGAAPTASAGHPHRNSQTWISGYTRCGCPVYSERYVACFDRWGRPVFHVRVLPVGHRCHGPAVRPRHGCGVPRHGCGVVQPNYRAWSTLPPRPLPQIVFDGRSVHVGLGLR